MMKRKLKQLTATMCAAACVATITPVMDVSARTYTAEELYSGGTLNEFGCYTDVEKIDIDSKYGTHAIQSRNSLKFGKISDNLNTLKEMTVSVENDRTGGINVRWTNCLYSVAIERYDYATKQWEFLDYKSGDESTVSSGSSGKDNMYMVDLAAGKEYAPTREAKDYFLYEDNTAQINKTYKYHIIPYIIYSQSRAEAIALGKEAEYNKIVAEYVANGCRVVEENGYTVVFCPSQETKKVKNTLEAPYMSVKKTAYCSKCNEYQEYLHGYNDKKCGVPEVIHKTTKTKVQFTFDIEWQDVDGYEIYRSSYSDTGFKKWKTIKPKPITHSETAYPARTSGQDGVISTTFLYHTKASTEKYFYKIRSFVVVNGKKIYSEFSPVTSMHDYRIHDRMYIKEANLFYQRAVDIQVTKEYNQLNRLMNEHAYLWQKYLSGKISKNALIKGSLSIDNVSIESGVKYGIYKKTVKTLNAKNIDKTALDIEDEVKAKYPKLGGVYCLSVNVSYKKSKKVYEISVFYKAS